MAKKVTGEQYYEIDGQLAEIKRQLRQSNGYPFDVESLKKHLQDGIEGRFSQVEKTETILEFFGTVIVPARTERFIAKNHFIVDKSKKARVQISYLGDNFRNNFLNKTEEAISETILQYHQLKKSSRDIPIINELGGKDKTETTLAEMFSLMEKQPNGEDGVLLINGYANIFYIRDENGFLWAVYCFRGGDGWYIHADSVDDLDDWIADGRVFSRNS